MRLRDIPPIFSALAAFLVEGCGPVVTQQRIIDGRVRLPSAPAVPILPEGAEPVASLWAGASMRQGARPPGGILDDSAGRPLAIGGSGWSMGALASLRWSVLRAGIEESGDRFTLLCGLEAGNSWVGLVVYGGAGFESFDDHLVLRQTIEDYPFSRRDTLVEVSESGWLGVQTVGGAISLGPHFLRGFAAARHIEGPRIDGTRNPTSSAPADNAIRLSRNILDFGLRCGSRSGWTGIAGIGRQIFPDSRIGEEWRAFAGISVPLWNGAE